MTKWIKAIAVTALIGIVLVLPSSLLIAQTQIGLTGSAAVQIPAVTANLHAVNGAWPLTSVTLPPGSVSTTVPQQWFVSSTATSTATVVVNGVTVAPGSSYLSIGTVALTNGTLSVPVAPQTAGQGGVAHLSFTTPNLQIVATMGNATAMNVTGPGTPAYGSDVTFTVTNTTGGTSQPLLATLSNSTNFAFDNGGTCINGVTTLGANMSCTIVVKPLAGASGAYTGTLSIQANNNPSISLSGAGTDFAANLVIAATTGNASAMNVVGTAPGGTLTYGTPVTLTVTNNGGLPSVAMSFALNNTANFTLNGGTCVSGTTILTAGASCTIIVESMASADGLLAANLAIAANNNPTIALSGTATMLSPASLSWVASGGTASAMNVTGPVSPSYGSNVTFTITNASTADYPSAALGFALSSTANFQFNGGTCTPTTTLTPGASCTVLVEPYASSNGSYTANLTTTANNAPAIALSGTATGFCNASTQTFTSTGTNQTFTVPTGCSAFTVKLWGAGGASGVDGNAGISSVGGPGGFTVGSFSAVPSGTKFTVVVGSASGFGGGGMGLGTGNCDGQQDGVSCQGGNGGGRSALAYAGNDLLTAGGGGGGAEMSLAAGGPGGGINGASGAQYQGGSGTGSSGLGGAGGGGGYLGGASGGGSDTSPGSGGSGYIGGASGFQVYGGLTLSGSGTQPPYTLDPAYQAGVGVGGASNGRQGGPGLVVISFTNTAAVVPNLTITATSGTAASMNVTGPGSPAYGASVTFTITNNGGAASGAISLALSNTTNFSFVSGGSCISGTTALAPNGTCTVVVQPAGTSNGTISGTLSVSANNNPSIALSGTVTGFDPCAAASPAVPTVCSDGTYYIGQEFGQKLFIEPNTQQYSTFNNGNPNVGGLAEPAAISADGKINTNIYINATDPNIGSSRGYVTPLPFNAANNCYNSTQFGHNDWYLPSWQEFQIAFNASNVASAAGATLAQSFPSDTGPPNAGTFWTSTDNSQVESTANGGGTITAGSFEAYVVLARILYDVSGVTIFNTFDSANYGEAFGLPIRCMRRQ